MVIPCFLVGLSYHGDALPKHNTTQHVTIEPDEHNKYDANAVKVLFESKQIGHIEKDVAKVLRPFLSEGSSVVLCCVVLNHLERRVKLPMYVLVKSVNGVFEKSIIDEVFEKAGEEAIQQKTTQHSTTESNSSQQQNTIQ